MQTKILLCFLVVVAINLIQPSFALPKGCKSIEVTKENAAKPVESPFASYSHGFFGNKGGFKGWGGRRGSGSGSKEAYRKRGYGRRGGWGRRRGSDSHSNEAYRKRGYGRRGGWGRRRGSGSGSCSASYKNRRGSGSNSNSGSYERRGWGRRRGYGKKWGKGKKSCKN